MLPLILILQASHVTHLATVAPTGYSLAQCCGWCKKRSREEICGFVVFLSHCKIILRAFVLSKFLPWRDTIRSV